MNYTARATLHYIRVIWSGLSTRLNKSAMVQYRQFTPNGPTRQLGVMHRDQRYGSLLPKRSEGSTRLLNHYYTRCTELNRKQLGKK